MEAIFEKAEEFEDMTIIGLGNDCYLIYRDSPPPNKRYSVLADLVHVNKDGIIDMIANATAAYTEAATAVPKTELIDRGILEYKKDNLVLTADGSALANEMGFEPADVPEDKGFLRRLAYIGDVIALFQGRKMRKLRPMRVQVTADTVAVPGIYGMFDFDLRDCEEFAEDLLEAVERVTFSFEVDHEVAWRLRYVRLDGPLHIPLASADLARDGSIVAEYLYTYYLGMISSSSRWLGWDKLGDVVDLLVMVNTLPSPATEGQLNEALDRVVEVLYKYRDEAYIGLVADWFVDELGESEKYRLWDKEFYGRDEPDCDKLRGDEQRMLQGT